MSLYRRTSFELEDLKNDLYSLSKTKTIVFVSGAYDLLHAGHITFLNTCKELGDILVVGVNSDQLVSKKKGPGRPIIPEIDRALMVSNLRCVDFTFIKRGPFMQDGIHVVNPHTIVFCRERDQPLLQYDEIIKKYGNTFPHVKCVVLDRQSSGTHNGTSTSKIIGRILKKI